MNARVALRYVMAVAMIGVGVDHFVNAAPFASIVPKALPAPLALVYISGAAEILGGVGLLIERTRRAAGIGLIALYVAVFPANVNMAVNHLPLGDTVVPPALAWARLPLQAVFIALAYWVAVRREPAAG
ncbi:MAG TPA: DoxX family membrane protein [Byssovorax sp.]